MVHALLFFFKFYCRRTHTYEYIRNALFVVYYIFVLHIGGAKSASEALRGLIMPKHFVICTEVYS